MNMHRPSVGLKSDWTDDGIPGGRYATGHCPVIVYVRWTRDGTLARGVVQVTGQTMRHILKEKSQVSFWSAKVHPERIKLSTAGKVNWTKAELLSLKRSTIDKKMRDNATRRSTSEIVTGHKTACRFVGV